MKTVILLCIAGASLLAPLARSQRPNIIGYRMAGDQIVFEFSAEEYTRVTDHHTGSTANLAAIPIHSVQVAGTFNQWQRDEATFKLIPMGPRKYTLRVGLSRLLLGKRALVEFKFLVNQRWWVEPPANASNTQSTGLLNRSTNFTITRR